MILVGAGGAAGSMLRYVLTRWLLLSPMGTFPIATFAINVLGSFLLGCLAGYSSDRDRAVYLFVGVGMCGGFTTFSTFSLELVESLQRGNVQVGMLYALLSVTFGCAAAGLGMWTGIATQ
jgi:fluoride exporter